EYQHTAWNYSISGASIEHSKPSRLSCSLGTRIRNPCTQAPMAPMSGFRSRRPVRYPTTGLFSVQEHPEHLRPLQTSSLQVPYLVDRAAGETHQCSKGRFQLAKGKS
ncbi:hypothetical protein CCUS01_15041, partial [Colletotrichum cuscutae]